MAAACQRPASNSTLAARPSTAVSASREAAVARPVHPPRATTVAVARLGESGPLVHLAFFLVTGILWILPAMGIIKWLMLPPRPKN